MRVVSVAACVLAVLLAPAVAGAQAVPPSVRTGDVESVTPTGATATGTVNPKGQRTRAAVQYGPAGTFTTTTPPRDVGASERSVPVRVGLGPLRPGTEYQYRLVARSAAGTTRGATRRFSTPQVPLALSLQASRDVVVFGASVTLQGTLSGSDAEDASVQVEARAFRFDTAFADLGAPLAPGPDRRFAFTHQPRIGVQYRAVAERGERTVASAVETVNVAPRVTLVARRVGGRVRFSGRVTPAGSGVARLRVRRSGRARTLATTGTDAGSGRFAFRPREVRRTAEFHVTATLSDRGYVAGRSRELRVRRS